MNQQLSWQARQAAALQTLNEVEYLMETAPWHEREDLRDEKSRILTELMECDIALNGLIDRQED